MIGMKIIGALIGRKAKEKVVDAVLDKVNLPDPVENAIKIAATGNVGDLIGGDAKEEFVKAAVKKVRKK
jgi:hypothetical protein